MKKEASVLFYIVFYHNYNLIINFLINFIIIINFIQNFQKTTILNYFGYLQFKNMNKNGISLASS